MYRQKAQPKPLTFNPVTPRGHHKMKYLVNVFHPRFAGSFYTTCNTLEEANATLSNWLHIIEDVVLKTEEVYLGFYQSEDQTLTFQEFASLEMPQGEGYYRLSNNAGTPDTFLGKPNQTNYKVGRYHFSLRQVKETTFLGKHAYHDVNNASSLYLTHSDPDYAWVALGKIFS